jgi:hypothetical protein
MKMVHVDFEPVAVGQDHVLGIKGQIRPHQNEPLGTIGDQYKTYLLADRLPEQVQTEKRYVFCLPIQLDSGLFKRCPVRITVLSGSISDRISWAGRGVRFLVVHLRRPPHYFWPESPHALTVDR